MTTPRVYRGNKLPDVYIIVYYKERFRGKDFEIVPRSQLDDDTWNLLERGTDVKVQHGDIGVEGICASVRDDLTDLKKNFDEYVEYFKDVYKDVIRDVDAEVDEIAIDGDPDEAMAEAAAAPENNEEPAAEQNRDEDNAEAVVEEANGEENTESQSTASPGNDEDPVTENSENSEIYIKAKRIKRDYTSEEEDFPESEASGIGDDSVMVHQCAEYREEYVPEMIEESNQKHICNDYRQNKMADFFESEIDVYHALGNMSERYKDLLDKVRIDQKSNKSKCKLYKNGMLDKIVLLNNSNLNIVASLQGYDALNQTEESIVKPLSDKNAFLEQDEKYVYIGGNKTRVPTSIYHTINWSNYRAATKKLLVYVFSKNILATHNLTGAHSSQSSNEAYEGAGKSFMKRLNPKKVSDVVNTVSQKCGVLPSVIRSIIRIRCSEENIMYQREWKMGN